VVEAVLRLWRLYQTPRGKKLARYTMVSGISAGVSFVVLAIVYGALRLWSEVPSTLFANIVAGVPSYYLNRMWVWGKTGRSHLMKEVIPFWVMSITGILLSMLTASLARSFAETHHLRHLERTVLVLGANISAFGILWVLKFLILNRLFAHEAAPSLDVDVEA
jgi:putative flippase GtrA